MEGTVSSLLGWYNLGAFHMTLLSVAEARERILSQMKAVSTETLPLSECADRVLAQDIPAPSDLPLFDNSAMDGFAIRADDLVDFANTSLHVVADIPAGSAQSISINKGEAARIMTGAPMPGGADAVIPVEDSNFQIRQAGTAAPSQVQFTRP